jgi:DNA (cytosine-5)-methyltransferase 1
VARGGKPTSDQQRSDPWHILTWLTELRVKRIIIENVWEFTSWGPVDPRTGKPLKARKGEYFRAWTDSLQRLGFDLEWRKLNAANYGDATTRSRFILKGRSDTRPLAFAPLTHRKREGGTLELFPGMKPWRPAREIIDWSIKGRSIFQRKKVLAPKTLARILAGAVKFGWPEPFLVILRNHMGARSLDEPVPALAAGGTHVGVAEPIIVSPRHGKAGAGPRPRDVGQPVPTLTGSGSQLALVEPLVLSQQSYGGARSSREPLPTITTGGAASERPGCARPMLVEPFVVTAAHSNSERERDPNGCRVKSVHEPLGTFHAGGNSFGLAEPFIFSRHADGAPRPAGEPTPTQVAKHSQCLISPYYGQGSGETCKSAEEPLPTATSKGRFGLVIPVTHADGSQRARDVETDPLPTLTTASRGELAFITAQFGEREGQAPRVHDIGDPAPAICAQGHVNLVEAIEGESSRLAPDGARPLAEEPRYDILFRMLEPHELAAAMGFTSEDAAYEFAGTKTEKVKQIGNAVSVKMMKAEVKAIMADAVKPAKPAEASAPERLTA